MTTVVDALIMTLGLDTRDYDKGRKTVNEGMDKTKKQANLVAKEMYEGGKKAATFFGSIKSELISLLAVAAAGKGLTSFLHDSIGGMAELGRQAANLSMAPKELDAWGAAAETVGGSVEGITGSLKSFAAGIEEFKTTGQSALVALLRSPAMNVAISDVHGKLLSYTEDFYNIADRFKRMSAQDALFFGKRAGFDEGTIQLLRQGGPAVKALVEQMSRLSGVTDAGVESAQRNQAEWTRIRMHFKGIRETLSTELDPALEKIAKRVLTWMDANHKLIATKIIAFVESFANFVMKLVDWLDRADTATDGWSTKILVAASAIRLLTGASVIGGLIGSLGRLIPLIAASTAGLWALAAAGAAVAGWGIGTAINNAIDGTRAGDAVGSGIAHVMSALGSKEATQAILDNMRADRAREVKGLSGLYRSQHPSFNATQSQTFGSNAELFAALEKRGNLPAGILQRMFMQESGGGKHLLSPAGAKGPFQFMDATAADVGLHGNEVYDLDKSAAAAAGYLVKLRGMFSGDITKAVAAYNAGPGNVRKYGGVPPFAETQAYVSSIMQGTSPGNRSSRFAGGSNSTSTSETKIGSIVVNTQATDAKGIVSDMRQELARNVLVASANAGPN